MSDLHTYKVMQDGDADGKYPRPVTPVAPVNPWLVALVALFTFAILVVLFYPVFTQNGGPHRNPTLSKIKQQALGLIMYGADYDDHLPRAESWMDASFPYIQDDGVFRDPDIKERQPDQYGFAFFGPVSGTDTDKLVDADKVPLTFQSTDLRRNANGSIYTRAMRPAGRGSCVSFVDGHAKIMPKTWPETPIVVVIHPSRQQKSANGK